MKLWTIQYPGVLDIINKTGVYRTEASLIDMPDFLPSYDWLCEYLSKKKEPPQGVKYPVWAWYRYNGKEKKPDLRSGGFAKRGTDLVCIEIEIPDNDVLLSDFDLWHFVLNNWWLDDSTCEEEYDKNYEWFDKLSFDKQQELKKKSWEGIFDLTMIDTDWIRKGHFVQAVFWELKKENIIKVQHFKAK